MITRLLRLLKCIRIHHTEILTRGTEKIEVYDVCIDTWRESNHVDQQFPRCTIYLVKYFIRILVIGSAILNTEDIVSILCFDIKTKVFLVMKMPDNYYFFGRMCYALLILSEYQTLISYPDSKSDLDPKQDLMDIWIMREYGV